MTPDGEPLAPPAPGEVTALLIAWRGGDAAALERLMPLVYAELRRLAAQRLRGERNAPTLQPTVLVHEAFLRLVDRRSPWQNRAHFFAVAARTMRRVAVDHARSRLRQKRGGGALRVDLTGVAEAAAVEPPSVDVLALDEALDRLEARDPQQARVVELRFFTGLSEEETAEALGISRSTVQRDWHFARLWLLRELGG